jgi:hypothetical protein
MLIRGKPRPVSRGIQEVFVQAHERAESSDNCIETRNIPMRLSNAIGVTICSTRIPGVARVVRAGGRQAPAFGVNFELPKTQRLHPNHVTKG